MYALIIYKLEKPLSSSRMYQESENFADFEQPIFFEGKEQLPSILTDYFKNYLSSGSDWKSINDAYIDAWHTDNQKESWTSMESMHFQQQALSIDRKNIEIKGFDKIDFTDINRFHLWFLSEQHVYVDGEDSFIDLCECNFHGLVIQYSGHKK